MDRRDRQCGPAEGRHNRGAIRDSDSFEESAEPEQKRSLEAISFELDRACERLAALPDFSVELGEEILRLEALAVDLRRIWEKGEA